MPSDFNYFIFQSLSGIQENVANKTSNIKLCVVGNVWQELQDLALVI